MATSLRGLDAGPGSLRRWILTCAALLLLPPRSNLGYNENHMEPVCGTPWWTDNLEESHHWPWEVSLQIENEHVCGGALIDRSWVVSAAHCIQSNKEYSVMLGSSSLNPNSSSWALKIPVGDIIMHPKYWGRNFIRSDIALLSLEIPVTFNKYVQPICLPEHNFNLKVGMKCWITGWGQLKQHSPGPWFWSCGQTNVTCKVVNGKVVEVGKWPWQVSILFLGVYVCSGSLIHHHWILTAAHCFQRSKNPANYTVKVGVQTLPDNSTSELLVTRIVIHENFINHMSHDIAILKLKYPVTWSPLIQPICLPSINFKPSIGTMCWVVGWGLENAKGAPKTPYSVQGLAVRIVNNEICNHRYQFLLLKNQKKFIGNDMLCTSSEWGLDTCQDTSGSSLVCQMNKTWIQMGVVSWNFGCGRRQFPSIYTSTSYFTHWIKRQIGDLKFASMAVPSFLSPLILTGYILLVSLGSLWLL
ncbi:serine protease 46 isoform X1 [Mastomys coucha]|uniref:serine protease 46 isoform X1 n=1 Tax=Mastomys coucha TaxID=35658 RepID=UPI0012627656|nr:serine protease 46 isoform X1 [Mastomys coucha]